MLWFLHLATIFVKMFNFQIEIPFLNFLVMLLVRVFLSQVDTTKTINCILKYYNKPDIQFCILQVGVEWFRFIFHG